MKTKNRFAAIALLMIFFIAGCDSCNNKATGEWIASGNTEALVFQNDGSFEILNFGYDYGPPTTIPGTGITSAEGPRIPNSGKWRLRYTGTYTIDYTKEPAWLDLVIMQNGNPRRQEGLIQFLDANTFYLAIEDVRPATIDNALRGKTRFTRAAAGEIKR